MTSQSTKKRDYCNGPGAHLFICQIFWVLECAGYELNTDDNIMLNKRTSEGDDKVIIYTIKYMVTDINEFYKCKGK